jgi:hypothetical protein
MGAITSDCAAPARLSLKSSQLVFDPERSPLDLAAAPNGNIVVSSEHPFGSTDAVTSVREYGATDGQLIRVFPADGSAEVRRPRGLRFTASPGTRSWPSISRGVDASAPSCDTHG